MNTEPNPAADTAKGCAGVGGSCLIIAIAISLLLFILLLNAMFPDMHLLW